LKQIESAQTNIIAGTYKGGKPDAIFSFADQDFVAVATGKMNPQMAFIR
jgi:putative sterol carrier protein